MSLNEKVRQLAKKKWPPKGLESVHCCPVCDSESRDKLYDELVDWTFFSAPGTWKLFKCLHCGSAYLDPRPSEESIGLAYSSYYTHDDIELRDFGKLSLKNRFRRILANGYRNWRYGTTYRPASRLGILLLAFLPRVRNQIDAVMRHLPRPNKGQCLLDFGCGNGKFLQLAKDAGWDAVGVDMDPVAVESAKKNGLDVRLGGREVLDNISKKFDVITLSHVIEHVPNPKALIECLFSFLTVDGCLWLETPNINAQGHAIYGAKWRGLEPPRHLVLFNLSSLTKLLVEVGFRRIVCTAEHPIVPSVFGASEAIKAGENPIHDGGRWAQINKGNWSKYIRVARKNQEVREFITMMAYK